jgi:regulator of nucleoside diphosphate kinase
MTTYLERHTDAVTSRGRPRIVVTAKDHARLTALARAAMNKLPDLASGLADELDRADVLPGARDPEDVVCMGSEVTFRDDTSGMIRRVTLVYPDAADIAVRRISVLTPVGTALLGLRAGDSIDWETPTGESRALTIIDVGGSESGG